MLRSRQRVQILKQKGKQWPHQMVSIGLGKLFILNSTYQLCFLLSSCLFKMFVMRHCAKVLKPCAMKCPGLMCVCFLMQRCGCSPSLSHCTASTTDFPQRKKEVEQIFIWMCRWQSWTSRIRCQCTHPPACPLKTTLPLHWRKKPLEVHSLSNVWWERHVFLHLTEVSHQDPCIYTHAGAEIFMGGDRECQNPSKALMFCLKVKRV